MLRSLGIFNRGLNYWVSDDMRQLYLLFLIFAVSPIVMVAQVPDDQDDNYDELEKKYERLRDSLAQIYPFASSVSSIIVREKELEVYLFSSLISANRYRDDRGNILDLNTRQSFLFGTLQLTYGVSKSSRVNAGLDITGAMARIDQDRNSSALKVFSGDINGNSQSARSFTLISPRIRWRPFRKNYNFIIQNAIGFPIMAAKNSNLLGAQQISFVSQFLYTQKVTEHVYVFPQVALQYLFKKGNSAPAFYSPVSLYASYVMAGKLMPFVAVSYIPIFTKPKEWVYSRYTVQMGAGLQYNLSRRFLINVSYLDDIKGKNYQDFETYSLGLRFITN